MQIHIKMRKFIKIGIRGNARRQEKNKKIDHHNSRSSQDNLNHNDKTEA